MDAHERLIRAAHKYAEALEGYFEAQETVRLSTKSDQNDKVTLLDLCTDACDLALEELRGAAVAFHGESDEHA